MSNNRPEILDFFGFTPTSSQNEVIMELQNFFAQAPEHSIFLLRGYAGTGKSSLVGAFSHMLQSFLYPQMLLAPTGRAAKVLEGYCGLPAYTIHRTIYRQRISGDGISYEVGYNQHQPGTIYIVDEASMINNANDGYGSFGSNRLLDDLVDFCFSIEGSKLLLIGDDAQLPPVGTEMSPALVPEYLVGFCSTLYQGILKDIVRQEEGGEIVYLSYLLRGRILDLQSGEDWHEPLLPLPEVKGEVEIISGYDLPELMEDSYRRVGQEETLLITRSNRDAEEYNKSIRYHTLYYDEEVVPGENLMVVRNNYLHFPVDEKGQATSTFIANGEILKVLNSRREQELYGFTFRDAELRDTHGGFVSAKVLLDSLFTQAPSLTPEQRERLYQGVCQDYPDCTTRRMLYQKLRQDPYLNALQIKYSYAMTCHKAQGGQWREVYLSFGYLTPEMIDLSFCRWLYTAMTRATEKLYIIQPPAFIFGNLEL